MEDLDCVSCDKADVINYMGAKPGQGIFLKEGKALDSLCTQ